MSSESSEDDYDYEYEDSGPDSDDFDDAVLVNEGSLPLIPKEYSSLHEAFQNFMAVFASRYGNNHPFTSYATLQEAMTEAFEAPGRDIMERKPLAIYLHNDSSVAANIFAQQIMCSDQVAPLLRTQFITWGWDVTFRENRTHFYDWLRMLNLDDTYHNLQIIPRDNYPVLLLLVKKHGTVSISSFASGHDTVERVMRKLMQVLEYYLAEKTRIVGEDQQRAERELLRAQQLAEYEQSKAEDRAKKEEQERKIREELEAEETRKAEEKAALERQAYLKTLLPMEPSASEKDIITIRLRYPNGEQQIRRFRMDEPVKWLVTFCESLGYDMKSYRIWNSDVPKKDVSTLDDAKSFRDLKWPSREQVFVEEK